MCVCLFCTPRVAQAEFRAGTVAERLNSEMEGERGKSRGLEEKLRVLEEVRGCVRGGGGYRDSFFLPMPRYSVMAEPLFR